MQRRLVRANPVKPRAKKKRKAKRAKKVKRKAAPARKRKAAKRIVAKRKAPVRRRRVRKNPARRAARSPRLYVITAAFRGRNLIHELSTRGSFETGAFPHKFFHSKAAAIAHMHKLHKTGVLPPETRWLKAVKFQ